MHFIFFAMLLELFYSTGHADPIYDQVKSAVGVDEKFGEAIRGEVSFTNHLGQSVRLSDYRDERKPTLLTLNYFSCSTMCGVQLNAVLEGLKELDWIPGENFNLVTISIDPEETAELAENKRKTYLSALNKDGVEWDFLVGDSASIDAIAEDVGYRYQYIEANKEYAHPAVIMILSPEGLVSRYLYGLSYPPRDLKFALMEAAEGRIGSPIEHILLSCFSYDNTTGKYTATAFGIMRLGGLITLFCLSVLVITLWRREIRSRETSSAK